MVKSQTKVSKQAKRKTNPRLVETINLTKKNKKWLRVAEVLSGPRRNWSNLNLDEINKSEGNIVVIGKILSQGEIGKKRKIVALSFSEKAREKLKNTGCEFLTISEEIKKNPEMRGLKILK